MITQMLQYFKPPSADSIALRELEESRRQLLAAQSAREYADSMCRCYEARIKRLTTHLREVHDANTPQTPINLGDIG
jgi:hypothetical protein